MAGNGGLGSRMLTGVKGKTGYLGNFKINFMVDQENMEQKPEFFFTAMPAPDPSGYTKAITSKLRLYQDKDSQASKKKNPAGLVTNVIFVAKSRYLKQQNANCSWEMRTPMGPSRQVWK